MPNQSNQNDVQARWPEPTPDELQAFMDAIPETLFGQEYVILAHRTEWVFCEIREQTAEGVILHARVLPFN